MAITVTSTFEDARRRFARLPAALERAEQRFVKVAGLRTEKRTKQHFVPYRRVEHASLFSVGLVRRRTSALLNSLNTSPAEKVASGWQTRVGFRDGPVRSYAKTIEYGATFTPSKKLLAIPVGEALTSAGVARYRSPLDVTNGFWAPMRGGTSVGFFARVGKRLQLLFVGRKRVEVKPFRPLGRSLDSERPFFVELFNKEADAAIAAALAGR